MPHANPTGRTLRASAPACPLAHRQVKLGISEPPVPLTDAQDSLQRVPSILSPRQLPLRRPRRQDRPHPQRPGIPHVGPDPHRRDRQTVNRPSHRKSPPQTAGPRAAAGSDARFSPPVGKSRPASATPGRLCVAGELRRRQDAADRSRSRPPAAPQPPIQQRETPHDTQPSTRQGPSRPTASQAPHQQAHHATTHDPHDPNSQEVSRPQSQRRAGPEQTDPCRRVASACTPRSHAERVSGPSPGGVRGVFSTVRAGGRVAASWPPHSRALGGGGDDAASCGGAGAGRCVGTRVCAFVGVVDEATCLLEPRSLPTPCAPATVSYVSWGLRSR